MPPEEMQERRSIYNLSLEEMLLDDPFQHGRIAGSIPGALGIDNRDRATFADAQAVGFGPQHPAGFGEAELFESTFQIVPGSERPITVATFRGRLIRAQEDMTACRRHANNGGRILLPPEFFAHNFRT